MSKVKNKTKTKVVDKKVNENKYLFIIAAVVILLIGTSFAWLQLTINGTKKTTIKAGTLDLVLDDSEEGNLISIENAMPVSDSEGESTKPYKFSIENTGNIPSEYKIYLDDASIDEGFVRMPDSVVKYSLKSTESNSEITTSNLISTLSIDETEGRVLVDTVRIEPDQTNNYELKLWIDESAGNEIMNNIFSTKLRVEATQIQE